MKGTEKATFEERVVVLYPQLFRLALRLCRNAADAHDLAQDAVERGLRCRGSFRTGDTPDRWISTILRRMFLDRCRVRRRRALVSMAEAGDVPAPLQTEAPRGAWEAFTAEDVQRAILFLDRESREVFYLFAFERLAQDEIGRRLSMSRKTVATRVFRTRAKLRKLLESGAYRRQLALVPPSPDPTNGTPGHGAAGGRVPQHPPRARTAARHRPRRVTATGSA